MFGPKKKKRLSLPLRSEGAHSVAHKDLMQRLSNSGNRIRRAMFRILAAAALIFLGYTFFGGAYGFMRIARLHAQKDRIMKANHQLLVKLITSDITRNRLENDLNYIEYIARTRHHFSRPGETIYRFKE